MQPESPYFLQLTDVDSIVVTAIRRVFLRRSSGTVYVLYIGGGDDLLEGDAAAAFLRWYDTEAQVVSAYKEA